MTTDEMRAIDREVAENVFANVGDGIGTGVPHFTTDIAAAWAVVERMRELGWRYAIDGGEPGYPEYVMFFTASVERDARADTIPLAICLAALAALAALEGSQP